MFFVVCCGSLFLCLSVCVGVCVCVFTPPPGLFLATEPKTYFFYRVPGAKALVLELPLLWY